jgi:hypothetical protein
MNTPSLLSSFGVSNRVISVLSDKARKALELIQSRAATTGGFVTFEYVDSKGDKVKYQVRFGADYKKQMELDEMRNERDGIPNKPKKPNWVMNAEKSGVKGGVLFYNGNVYVMGTKVKRNKSEDDKEKRAIRTMKVEQIANMISGQSVMDQMEAQAIKWENERMERELAGHPGF